ncbi:hypothetical protein [Gemmata sp.]|uniref:hypothetical protein n=1 Tax=Gemmata sp. TaxID=1914242 RepID=UPI003F705923
MNSLDRADAYLTVPRAYAEALGIRWGRGRDAIERHDESVLAFAEELRSILDGVFAAPQVPPFAFVLAVLDAMKRDRGPGLAPLRRAFEATRGGVGRRNVGLLAAELCRGLPGSVAGVSTDDIAAALQCLRMYGEHARTAPEEPPLTPDEFDRYVASRLVRLTDDDLRQWLTHGTGPSAAYEKLAEEAEALPARVARLLALARKRQRLVGAAVLVPALDAGLTLPPRRRSPDAPPQGGYCDVTTRGEPEQLLPTQFALDPDEFIRRFASHELLYFQKEEPHQPAVPERVIVLDQGVRTWGSVRLALAAAALSLLAPRAKRCASVKLHATSARGPVDVTGPEPEAVAEVLEASDLTPDPAACLARALRDPDAGTGPRDVILLTHPRSVPGLSVSDELEQRPGDRVFALAVDDRGRAELSQWTAGGVATIRTFRVDLDAAEAARPDEELGAPRPVFGAVSEWNGPVEPVPFPFRTGLVAEPHQFGFDADCEWCVIAGANGVLHGLALDGSAPEVLPRAVHGGTTLQEVDAVLGITGGVVVCGRIGPAGRREQIAAYYDRTTRTVTVHALGPALHDARWYAYPDLHCIAVRADTVTGCALDLGTSGRSPDLMGGSSELVSRARVAWARSATGDTPPHNLPLITASVDPAKPVAGQPFLGIARTACRVRYADPEWPTVCEPLNDGKPLLEGATVHRAQLAGSVLALALVKGSDRKLVLLRGPDGNVIGEVTHPARNAFALSADGRFLARRDAVRSVIVSATSDVSRALATAPHAALHNALDVRLDAEPFRLVVAIGTFAHTFRVSNGELRYSLALGWDNFPEPKVPLPASARTFAAVEYDPARFPVGEGAAAGAWRAVLDRLGQVLLFARGELVAAFSVRRERAAAWLPGGVFWGTTALIGGPATPNAEKIFAKAIEAAGR